MKKSETVAKLRRHAQYTMRGQQQFAVFFAEWLDRLIVPADEKFDFYDIDPYLPQLAMDAWETMRTGSDQFATKARMAYEKEMGRPMVNPIELGDNILDQALSSTMIGHVLSAIVDGLWVEKEVQSYFGAQRHALQGMFDKFLRLVYQQGLFEIINKDQSRGMSGKFGSTTLSTWSAAGRMMFTFARPKKRGQEVSVSFVAGDEDALALEAGIQSAYANLPTAIAMIEDVIRHWPKDSNQRRLIYSGADVAPEVVFAMRARAEGNQA